MTRRNLTSKVGNIVQIKTFLTDLATKQKCCGYYQNTIS